MDYYSFSIPHPFTFFCLRGVYSSRHFTGAAKHLNFTVTPTVDVQIQYHLLSESNVKIQLAKHMCRAVVQKAGVAAGNKKKDKKFFPLCLD